ncbi:hypothetical protein PEBR_01545 [Penicillium brasilianum]|uniref:Pyrroline-5-carboxylate reductase n=1 Tax=Penicillium brasilianum TaxID=104259 RepID=A0A1S9S0B5_PENBI|nr:hypothetical protein PEBR_01545 [Penicillium brasilianum]
MGSVKGTTITFLGCGVFGTAILQGVVRALEAEKATQDIPPGISSIQSLYACVRSPASAARIQEELGPSSSRVTIVHGDSGPALEAADVIVLTCRPRDVLSCLGSDRVRHALQGKLLVSGVAGVSISDLRALIAGTHNLSSVEMMDSQATTISQTQVVRVMANLCSMTRQSITVATMEEEMFGATHAFMGIVEWIFAQVGTLRWVEPSQFNACVSLCSSGPAFMATFIEALADGAVVLGVDRKSAVEMAALMAQGTASLILAGRSTTEIRNGVSTPGGSTIQGILEMEERGIRPMGVHTIGRSTKKLTELSGKK